jgi:Asp-tRNA(Asn)/Glu-tRNA(Gln) amidotransferase A subunit family amidase
MTPPGTDERWTAVAIAEDVRGGRRSAAEVIDEALDRIAGANGALNAFCEVRPRAARAAAAALDARIAAGEDLDSPNPALPLAGVPVAVKDVIWEAGVEATDGSRSLLGFVPQEDAIVVQRLTAAGAIVVGRTNVPEFCYRGICANDLYGVTSNPWDLGRTPGGSSGGSAAAVAAGLVPLAIGTDGGGSIRIPSSFCGVAGFKGTFGVVPREPEWPGWLSLTHVGPIAFTVEDCALMQSVIAGPDLRDPMSLPPLGCDPTARERGDLRGLRVAYSEDLGYVPVDEGVRRAFSAAIERFAWLGAELVAAAPAPFSPNPVDIWNTLTTTDNLASEGPLLETGRVGADARGLIEPGADVSGLEYVRARNAQWEYACAWGRFMTEYDLLLTPAMECVAFEHGRTGPATIAGEPIGEFYDDFCHFSYPFNLTGQPAISVPMGTAEHGLPVGLQIVGRRFEDDLVLAAGAAWERLGAWPRAPREQRAPLQASGAFASLPDGEGSVSVDVAAAAGERIGLEGEVAEIRRVLSPRDGEWAVEYERGPQI